jgi:predicted regulator of Ras-like GTPase activity (Roadblock/LC7/MglB family)
MTMIRLSSRKPSAVLAAAWVAFASTPVQAQMVGTAFTYQGTLEVGGLPAQGSYDLRFGAYFDATGGTPLPGTTLVIVDDAGIDAGVFTVDVDLGPAAFLGGPVYLEIGVREGAAGGPGDLTGFTTLQPRQRVRPAPYALHAEQVPADAISALELAPQAVTTVEISDGTISTPDLDFDAVTASNIVANAVGASEIADGAVGSAELAALAVTDAKIANGTITQQKLAFAPGDITEVTAGTGLVGGASFGNATLSLDSTAVQLRVTGSCPVGQYFRGIAADGSVACELVPGVPSISVVDDPGVGGLYTSLAIGSDGLPVISHFDDSSDALRVVKCNDAACVGGDETRSLVDDPAGRVGLYSSIAVPADGLPVVAYYDDTADALKIAKCNDPACSGGDETLTTVDDSASNVGMYARLALGFDDLPVVAYYDATARSLKVLKCNDAACSGGDETISTVDDPGNTVGQHAAIAIGADGFPIIAYEQTAPFALKAAKCNDAACSGGNETLSIVDPGGGNNVGKFAAIAVGAGGLPVISYFDDTADALKVARCNDVACSGGDETLSVVDDTPGREGQYTSIAVGNDGLPVISYYDGTAAALKVAHCNDQACSGGDETRTTVDDPNSLVGDFSSIAIGADGLPVISYRDDGAGALRVAKCGNRACI